MAYYIIPLQVHWPARLEGSEALVEGSRASDRWSDWGFTHLVDWQAASSGTTTISIMGIKGM